jgi:hypothetical protein
MHAGSKDHGVASSTGDISAGRPDDPDLQSGKARVEAEKTQPRIVPLSGKPYFRMCRMQVTYSGPISSGKTML